MIEDVKKTRVEVTEDEIFINGSKVIVEKDSLFIENIDSPSAPLRVTLTLLAGELKVSRGFKEPERKKISPEPYIIEVKTTKDGSFQVVSNGEYRTVQFCPNGGAGFMYAQKVWGSGEIDFDQIAKNFQQDSEA